MFHQQNVSHVNLLFTGDTDMLVLRTIDWKTVLIEVIVAPRTDPKLASYLVSVGYMQLDQFLEDDVFIHPLKVPDMPVSFFTLPFRRQYGHPNPHREAVLTSGLSPLE